MTAPTLPTALYEANQHLGQRLANALMENQQRWLDLGARQLNAIFMTSAARTSAGGSRTFGDNPLWQPGWMCEATLESTLAIQSAFADEVSQALAEWQQACAKLLPAGEAVGMRGAKTADGDVRA